jgi:hypothetical protein
MPLLVTGVASAKAVGGAALFAMAPRKDIMVYCESNNLLLRVITPKSKSPHKQLDLDRRILPGIEPCLLASRAVQSEWICSNLQS